MDVPRGRHSLKTQGIVIISSILILAAGCSRMQNEVVFQYAEVGFSIDLPESWEGYQVESTYWEGLRNDPDLGDVVAANGPMITIQHPDSDADHPRQGIPVMVLTLQQWEELAAQAWHIGAAPLPPTELGRNSSYVFALPARYNYAFLAGWEEVEEILGSGSILITEPEGLIPLPASTTPGPAGWQPLTPGLRWQWQLSGLPVDGSLAVEMFDIDLFDNPASTVAALQASGKLVVCYLNAGAWEDWRPDAGRFPELVIGDDYQGWPGESWLDIRQLDLLGPIMTARLDLCAAKGFDGVEPDNIDGYQNDTGFPLSYQDQLAYNIWLAEQAHARGLSIGLKNDSEQAGDLVGYFDWALAEDCFAEDWCQELAIFIDQDKAVLAAEYRDRMTEQEFLARVCPLAGELGISPILKRRDLDAWRQACP